MIKYILGVIITTSIVLVGVPIENKDSKPITEYTYFEITEVEDVPMNRSLAEPLTIDLGEFKVTAYDLSVQSCGKRSTHPLYGITANGTSLVGQTWETARAVAVDPKIIPLGTELKITFDKYEYMCYNGIYKAVDTGSEIKGNDIDLFLGENATEECSNFGVTTAKVEVIE